MIADAAGSGLRASRDLVALGLALFSLYTAAFGVLPDTMQRSVHLACALFLVFTLRAGDATGTLRGAWRALDLALALVAVAVVGYHVAFYQEIAERYGAITELEVWLGLVTVLVLLDATRRVVGWPLAVLAALFVLYALLGPWLPGPLGHRGYSVERTVSHLYLGADGIFGTPLGVSATFVILIVIFGMLLERTGAGRVLMDVAVGLSGRARGGPAKAAVIGSSLMGTISGTAVANVLTTGTISIPLMRRSGYRPQVAGAIEAVASTGGQLAPPIMGAAAFIMADITQTPYARIAAAAILPALLFYVAVFAAVHLEAVRTGVRPLGPEELPDVPQALREGGHLLLTLPVFVWLLVDGYSVMYAAFWAIVATLALSLVRSTTRRGPLGVARALIAGSHAVLTVAIACASAGIVIGVITLTGLGLKFSSLIVALSGGNLLLALVLTMLTSLVLGMGLPTAAAYILVATLVAPALVELGVNLLAAHFFVFYSAMLSAITPPVALAAYAAASISGGNPLNIAVIAVRFGLAAFIVPFFFAYDPVLLGEGSPLRMLLAGLTATVGAVGIAAAMQGWLLVRCPAWQRALLAAGALGLLFPGYVTDLASLLPLGVVLAAQLARRSRPQHGDEPTGAVAAAPRPSGEGRNPP